MSDLPRGWVQVSLGQVATTQLGRMLSAGRETGDHPKPYLRNRDVQWGHINVDELPLMDFSPDDAARFLLRPGDVLVCEGGEVGRAAIWNSQLSECYYQKALHRVCTSPALLPEFLRYLLEHYAGARVFERYTSGSTIAHLPQEDLRNLPVPIPGVAEQERIVAAIEEQFSRLDAGVAALERARQNIRRMRAAVLLTAVTGRSRSGGASEVGNAELPAGWSWRPFDEIILNLRNGIFVSRPRVEPSGLPILRISAVRPMALNVEDVRYVPAGVKLSRAEDYLVEPGDLLFTRYSGNPEYVGACAMVPAYAMRVLHPDKLIRVTVDRTIVDPRFIEMAASVGVTKQAIRTRVKTTAGQTGISGADLKSVPFPIPPIDIQRRIIEEVDGVLVWLQRTENCVNAAGRRSSALRYSVLSAAFSGKLIPQDSDDELASDLLERIAADRTASNGYKSTRSRRPHAPQEEVTA